MSVLSFSWLLSPYQWYRRRVGGHWERWHVDEDAYAGDPFGAQPAWFHLRACSRQWPTLAPPDTFGEPECEDYQ
jgi:hypothetical protein